MADGILSRIGSTPLVRLRRVLPETRFRLFAKLEGFNPGGSIKDRPALAIIEDAIAAGDVRPDTVVIESSSGNMGIGLAQICRYHGLAFICVVDRHTTRQNVRVLEAYGARVVRVMDPDPETGELLPARLQKVETLRREIPHAFWPNQYANEANALAHYRTTMREIHESVDGGVDYLFLATSTCGTLRGCGDYVRDHGLDTRIVAVDAKGSRIFCDDPADRSIPGLGAGIHPPLCDVSLVDRCVHVGDRDCITGCRWLVNREAILAGGSSGGVIAAVARLRDELPEGATCVAILSDRGDRYLDTVYSDEWVRKNYGDISSRWEEPAGETPRPLPEPLERLA